MDTLNLDQLSALESLSAVRPGPAAVNAHRFVKAARRAERFARFEASLREGLRYSRQCSRRLVPHKGDGGAVFPALSWRAFAHSSSADSTGTSAAIALALLEFVAIAARHLCALD
jgi:hypothetical protein